MGTHIKGDKDHILHISYVVLQMDEEINTEQSTVVLREHGDQISGHPENLLRKTADGFLRFVKFNPRNQRLFSLKKKQVG